MSDGPRRSASGRALASAGRIRWVRRGYQPGDLAGHFLAFSAPRDHELNQAIFSEAEERGIPLGAVDDQAHSSFILPAVHRQGGLLLAVSTCGASPALASRIRDRLAGEYGPEYAVLLDLMAEARPAVAVAAAAALPDYAARKRHWFRVLDGGILDRIRAGDIEAARAMLRAFAEKTPADRPTKP